MDQLRAKSIDRLKNLESSKRQIAFAYSVCHRVLPNYQYFSRNYGWGNEYHLIEALDFIRHFLLTDSQVTEKSQLLPVIYQNIPNADNFSTSYSTYAQSAASAIYYTLNSIPKVDIQELSWTMVVSRDTVDAFIQDIEKFPYDEKFEGKIISHWMMQRELNKQETDFNLLSRTPVIDEEVLESLIEFNEGKSNIDVQLFNH